MGRRRLTQPGPLARAAGEMDAPARRRAGTRRSACTRPPSTRKVIGRLSAQRRAYFGDFLDELTTALEDWLKTWNASARPFKRTKTADQIIDRICRYCRCISGPGHQATHPERPDGLHRSSSALEGHDLRSVARPSAVRLRLSFHLASRPAELHQLTEGTRTPGVSEPRRQATRSSTARITGRHVRWQALRQNGARAPWQPTDHTRRRPAALERQPDSADVIGRGNVAFGVPRQADAGAGRAERRASRGRDSIRRLRRSRARPLAQPLRVGPGSTAYSIRPGRAWANTSAAAASSSLRSRSAGPVASKPRVHQSWPRARTLVSLPRIAAAGPAPCARASRCPLARGYWCRCRCPSRTGRLSRRPTLPGRVGCRERTTWPRTPCALRHGLPPSGSPGRRVRGDAPPPRTFTDSPGNCGSSR